MKTSNKILLTGATVLVASILVNICLKMHTYRTDSAYLLQLDSLLQRRTIRVLVELQPFDGYLYKPRKEQVKKGRFSTTLSFQGTTPPTPETVRIQGDTLFIGAPIRVGSFPNVELFIGCDGRKYNVPGLILPPDDAPRFEDLKLVR